MRILTVKKSRIIKLVVLALVVGVCIYLVTNVVWVYQESRCSELESQLLIQELCHQYKEGKVAGNICEDLCTTHTIKYYKCTNYRGGKKVLFTECKDKCVEGSTVKAVLKTKDKNLVYDSLYLANSKDGGLTKDSVELTKAIFRDRIHSHLKKTDLPDDLFSYLWSLNYYDYVNSKNNDVRAEEAALQSIWSLANQDEYLLIKLYQDLPYIPKLYGSCGGYYLLEFAPPGNILNQDFIRYSPSPWKDRAKIALQLIELSQSVEKDFYEPLHICDVKGENFGLDTHNVIKFIDLDTIFFHKEMLGHLSSGVCTKHDDCDFFDCRGWCNITRNRCTRVRTNNNIQSICEDILVDRAINFYSGLLYYPPSNIKTKLNELLEKCAYPNNSKGSTVRHKTESDVYWELYNILKYNIQV